MLQCWKMCLLRSASRQLMLKTSEQFVSVRQVSSSIVLCDSFRSRRTSSKKIKELLDNAQVEENIEPTSLDSVWLTNPYQRRRDQANYSFRPEGDPSEWSIILFPGQGTQYVGMAKTALQLGTVQDMFAIASEILQWDLAKLCIKGPQSELDKTVKSQPAILVSSLAALEMMRAKEPKCVEKCIATAGFSLGEYAALVFAGSISFEDAVRLVKLRGEAMQQASELVQGSMMTVIMTSQSQLGRACQDAVRWCADNGIEKPICTVANYLYPHCKVIAGHTKALDFVERNAKNYHLRRCRYLPVSGAFHTKLMKPAVEILKNDFNRVEFQKPLIPVHSNYDGKRYSNGFHIGRLLLQQITQPVKWEQTLHILTEYKKESLLPKIFECGPGRSLSTILKMVNTKAECHSYDV